jgi:iron complex transport system ATP-binding protein
LPRAASSTSVVAGADEPTPLEVIDAFVGYGDRDVLRAVTLSIAAGELLVVIGPNGAGKSTLLRMLAGTLPPRAGTVRLFGADISQLPRRNVARRVAFLSQASEVAFGYRVEQVVMMGRSPHQGGLQLASADDREAVGDALRKVGVEALRARRLDQLSGGEQKLVALARAFAQRPEVLLLDEPSAHLDPRHSIGLFEVVLSEVRARRLACIAIAHDLNLAAAFADRVVLLDQGRVKASGSVDVVMTTENLTAAFDVELYVDWTSTGSFFIPLRRPAKTPDTRPSRDGDL